MGFGVSEVQVDFRLVVFGLADFLVSGVRVSVLLVSGCWV